MNKKIKGLRNNLLFKLNAIGNYSTHKEMWDAFYEYEKELSQFGVMPSLPDGLDDNSNCDHNFKLGWIACWKSLTSNKE